MAAQLLLLAVSSVQRLRELDVIDATSGFTYGCVDGVAIGTCHEQQLEQDPGFEWAQGSGRDQAVGEEVRL
jgi:hypothetical protein